ncbi:YadA-like family protein [Burkholderia cenocepacia]|uniref:YadA-like family protein n=4 Tax=Burkholderia cenocepacia TaxID=95486 RepID=UPI0024AF4B1A|nr:YadA-like family protein [Burkholderia cenocepacia]
MTGDQYIGNCGRGSSFPLSSTGAINVNKSYRTVWNATTGTWAAAPETARMRTKSKANSTMRSSVTAAVAVMAGVGGGTMSVDAMAQATGGGLNLCSSTTAANGVRYGQTFGALSNTSANCGPINSSLPSYQGHTAAFILANNANTNGATAGVAPTASVMGGTDGHLVVYGQNGVHISGPADFNNNVNMTNHRITGLAAGTAGTDAVNLNQLNSAIASAATASNPYVAISTGTYAAATAARAGSSATAIGANANATGTSAVALGGNTVASAQNATAIGTLSRATGSESAAVGTSANAAGANASAFGQAAGAQAANTTAMGSRSAATADGATALGYSASAVGANAIAVGRQASTSGTYGTAIGYQAKGATNAVGVGVLADARGTASVALGNRASGTGTNSVAVGSGATAGNANAVALGAGSVTNRDNTVSVGSAGQQRQITNVAAGTQNTDAVNLGQMNTALSTKVDNTYFKVNSTAAGSVVTSANSIAIGPGASATPAGAVGSNSIAIGNGAAAGGTDSIMIGTNARHAGSGGTVVGGNASAMGGGGAAAFGLNSAAGGVSSLALGTGALASGRNSVALGGGSVANADNTVSVGSTAVQRRIVNLAAGTGATDAVNVSQLTGVTKALGGGAAVGADGGITNPTYNVAGTDYHNVGDALDALASSGIGNPNAVIYDDATKGTVTLGGTAATAPVALKNVADAKDDHDALNLGQLKNAGLVGDDGAGNLTSLAVTYDDATKDTATLAGASGTTLSNVKAGVADMDAVNVSQLKGSGLIGDDGKSIAAVTYDRNADGTPNYGSVTLGNGAGPTQVKNVADATDDHDALNLGQLKDTGLVGDDGSGNLTSLAVTYDDATKTAVTLGDGATPVAIHNVADGVLAADSKDAVNGSQLFATNTRVGDLEDSLGKGGVIDPVTGESLAVVYDSNTKDTVTLAGASGTTLSNVKAGVADMDAVNVSQLKGSGLIGDDGKSIAAVTYDRNADGTPNYGSVTLGNGAGPTQVKNVADATDDHDALNLGQLKDAGLVGDDGSGNLTSLAVTYDGAAKDSVTLGGMGATAPVAIHNVADGVLAADSKDAVNGSQLFATNTRVGDLEDSLGKGGVIDPVTGESLAVVYDSNVKDTVTLAGASGTTLSNVKAGVADMDAVNVSQLKGSGLIGDDGKSIAAVTYDRNADGTPNYGTVTLGNGAGPTQVKNVADATDDHDALNLGQLKDAGLVGDDGAGNLTSMAVTYDGSARDKVTLAGVDGTTLSNVKAGVADMDAVNVSQLKGSGLIGDDGKSIAAVTYDRNADGTPNYGTVTLGNGAGPTQVKNVADATDDHDALNLGQLKDAGLVGDDGSGNLTSLAVTYDGAAKDSVTLGGVGATAPVALHNVADGVLSATSKDAVNGSQLFATNTRVGDLEDSLGKGGVIDPVTGESLAVVYDSNVKDTVTLAGTTGTTLSNVKAGVADMDAVNVSQLKDSGLIDPSTGKSIAAVTYDRNADGTPNYGTVTLGNGAGPTQIKNVATGVDDLDAVNVKQLNTGLSDLEDRMSGGNLRFVKVNADPLTGTPAVASGALAVAIGSDARATSANSLALGSGARVTGNGSVAIGYNSVANQNNVVSVGDVGRERKIVNVADGDVAFQSTDAVNGGQLYAALNTLSTSVTSKTQQAIDTFSSEIDKKTKAAIDEVSARSMQPMDVSDPLVAIEGLQGNNVASLNGADPTKATAAAIGSSTAASGANAVAVGLQSGAGSNNSVAIGSFAQTGAGQDYSVAVGSNVQTNGTQAVALGANAQANGEYALAVGNNGAQAIGDGSIAVGNAANVRAGATNAVAIGTGANVARSVEGAMALGANATAGAANSIALGANAFSDRANALSVGRAGAERQIVNVAAGTQTTDAVNVGQLKGVTDSLGGGSAVGADGKVTNPTYSLADPADASKSKSYDNVGDALSNLDGRTATNTQNITVINKQLADSGLVDPVTGQSIAAVTYDRNPDGTPNMGSVTLGGASATAPVALKNVADGTDRHDAINVGQLQDAGLVAPVDPSNPGAGLTSLAVAYDGVAKDVVTLAGAGGTTLSNVKAGVADMDAVNVSQLKDSGLIDPSTGKAIAAVTYDRNADGTPNYGSATLGNGTGPTQLKNVADAKDDGDALNLGQLKDAGLVGDDGSGNLTSMAVTYDGTAKDSVTLGGAGAAAPVALHNVADGVLAADSKDAVNGSQLFATNQNLGDLKDSLEKGGVIDPTTGESLAVVYDSAAKNSVTLGNAGVPVAIHNVAAGAVNATSHDAVNGSQLFTVSQSVADKIGGGAGVGADGSLTDPTYSVGGQDYHNVGDALGALDKNSGGNPLAVAYDSAAKDTVTLGGASATTPVALKNVADAKDDGDALNLGQLKNAGLVGDDGAGNLTSMAVTYDGAARDKVTLAGVDGTTLSNVKAGVADMDAVNVSQLKDAGLIDPSTGKPIAAVTYDSAAKDSVTLGGAGATTPVALKNVADAKDDGDALNLGQLKNAGLVGDDGAGNLTSMAVTYDGAAKDTVTLGGTGAAAPVALKNVADGTDRHDAINVGQLQDAGLVAPVDPSNPGAGLTSLAVAYDGVAKDVVTLKGTDGTTLSNVKAGVADMDAVNVSQLKDAGLIDPSTGKSIAAVTYDRNPDGTPNYGSVTLGNGTGPTQLKNVADATDDGDALNLGQLKNAGLVGEDGSGKLTSMAVTYDSAAKDAVTLGGAGATTPVALKNVADGTDRNDAINLGQLQDAGLVAPVDPTNPGKGLTSLAVAYDSATQDVVTLKGTDGTTLTNVKAGAVTATSTDAINGAQLHGTAQSVADSLGGGSTVGADGKVTNPTYSLADPADASKSVAYNNVGDALSNLDGRTVTNTENITVINKQLADSGLVDPVTGQSIAAVTYDRNADGTPNMGSVTLGGAGATAPVALKNVADGTDRHDAINLGQLQDAGLVAPVDPTNPGAGLASLAVTYGKNADGSANFDQVTLAGANGTTISNVKAGAVSATSTDAINGAQLHGVSQSVAKSLGGGASVDADGNVTNPSYKVSDKTFDNVGDAIENISNSLVHGSIGLVQQDDTTRDITVAKDTDGTTVNFAGTAGNRVLTGVAAGAVSATSVDAVNGSQLHGTAQSVADVIGGGTTVDADGKLADTSIEVNGSKYKTVAEAVQAAAQYGATDSLAVRYDLNRDGTPNYGSVTLGGTGAAPVRLTNVADGASQYDAVNFGQLSELSDRIGGLDDRVGDLEQRPPGSGGPGNGGSGNDYFAGTDVGTGSTTPANAGAGTGNTAAGSGATIGTGANNATVIGSNAGASQSSGVAIGSGAKSAAEGATAIGSGSNASGNQSVAIGSGANASGSNSVALGAGSTAYGDDTVSVGSIDRTRTISNVSDGVNATDVATKGQLDRAMGGMQGQVNDLSRNAYSGIAAATALTMIPGVDPGKTISFGIGGATYKGYQAVAFGGEARITQNLKMKAGVGMSSGGNTVGVGASYQW